MNLIQAMIECKYIAQKIFPKDTGNAAFYGINANLNSNGFSIVYDTNKFPYIEYLEEGTRRSGKHVGVISQNTVYAVTKYFDDKFNGRESNETANWQALAELSKTNPARQAVYLREVRRG